MIPSGVEPLDPNVTEFKSNYILMFHQKDIHFRATKLAVKTTLSRLEGGKKAPFPPNFFGKGL